MSRPTFCKTIVASIVFLFLMMSLMHSIIMIAKITGSFLNSLNMGNFLYGTRYTSTLIT